MRLPSPIPISLPFGLPTPSGIAARVLPKGVPFVRDLLIDRSKMFGSALDPSDSPGDPGLFGPHSATWALVGQPTQALAGLRAALLQALSVPIPTATDSTGMFYEDFLGRVSRTGAYVQAQNLGSMDEVYRSARRVRAMHRTVSGVGRDGTRFDATDLHQSAWVSMTLTDSVLVMAERFGRGPVSRKTADAFVREQSTHAALLDQRLDLDDLFGDPDKRAALQTGELKLPLIEDGELPTTLAELHLFMDVWTEELSVSRLTRKLLDATVNLEGLSPEHRAIGRPFMLATLHTIRDEWHTLLAPNSSRFAEWIAAQQVHVPLTTVAALLGELPVIQVARRRALSVPSSHEVC